MRSLLINAFAPTDEQNRRFCFCRGAVYLHEDVVRVKVMKKGELRRVDDRKGIKEK